jgi:hypothetical protein
MDPFSIFRLSGSKRLFFMSIWYVRGSNEGYGRCTIAPTVAAGFIMDGIAPAVGRGLFN